MLAELGGGITKLDSAVSELASQSRTLKRQITEVEEKLSAKTQELESFSFVDELESLVQSLDKAIALYEARSRMLKHLRDLSNRRRIVRETLAHLTSLLSHLALPDLQEFERYLATLAHLKVLKQRRTALRQSLARSQRLLSSLPEVDLQEFEDLLGKLESLKSYNARRTYLAINIERLSSVDFPEVDLDDLEERLNLINKLKSVKLLRAEIVRLQKSLGDVEEQLKKLKVEVSETFKDRCPVCLRPIDSTTLLEGQL